MDDVTPSDRMTKIKNKLVIEGQRLADEEIQAYTSGAYVHFKLKNKMKWKKTKESKRKERERKERERKQRKGKGRKGKERERIERGEEVRGELIEE